MFQSSSILTIFIEAKFFKNTLNIGWENAIFLFTVNLRLYLRGYYNNQCSLPVLDNAAKDAS